LGQREKIGEKMLLQEKDERDVARTTAASHTRQEGRKCILDTILIPQLNPGYRRVPDAWYHA